MEKVRDEKVMTVKTTHEFFCDECGIKIGESTEYDDGWYPEYGEYEQSICTRSFGWYKLHKNLCSNCANIYDLKIKEALINLGFEKER